MSSLSLEAVITMAASSSDARILSTPVIMTADNTEAQIIVGEERPVVSTTSTTDSGTIRSSFEYRNIGINLTVTPRINPEKLVVMEINQTADDVGGEVLIDGNAVPIITKREFSAQVAVNNRETIVLGGLVRNTDRDSSTKVPILGDIPLLGSLFRSESSSEERTELLVLLTPYVLMTQEEVASETTRLHDATQLRRTGWTRGWSDSKLAREPLADQHKKKAEKKLPKQHRKKDKKQKGAESAAMKPKISAELVYAEDLQDDVEVVAMEMTPEVILEIPSEPEPDDLVPMFVEEEPQVEVLVIPETEAVEEAVTDEPDVAEGDEPEPLVLELVEEPVLEASTEVVAEKPSAKVPVRSLQERRMSGPPGIPGR